MLFQKLSSSRLFSWYSSAQSYGTLWTWGNNSLGYLGQGDVVLRSSPTQVGTLATWKRVTSGSREPMHGIRSDGTLWAWGSNDTGKLGIDIAPPGGPSSSSPTQVGTLGTWSIKS